MNFRFSSILASIVDAFEARFSTQSGRTRRSVARIASLIDEGVHPAMIARVMTDNSRKNDPDNPVVFTAEDVRAIARIHNSGHLETALEQAKQRSGQPHAPDRDDQPSR